MRRRYASMESERWIKQTRNEEKREAGPADVGGLHPILPPAHLSGWQLKGTGGRGGPE